MADSGERRANPFDSVEKALKCLCITQEYLVTRQLGPTVLGEPGEVAGQRVHRQDDQVYDVLEFKGASGQSATEFFFDVSSVFGRGSELILPVQDLPHPHQSIPLASYFRPEEIAFLSQGEPEKLNSWLREKYARPRISASSQQQMLVALLHWQRSTIDFLPVRRFLADPEFPLLHGHRFCKLFVTHQLIHWMTGHDPVETEAEVRNDLSLPRPGIDCIAFQPLPEYTFANDFVNYMLWAHKPDAFCHPGEQLAFKRTAFIAIGSGLFSRDELDAALAGSGASHREIGALFGS